jgi:hypothetical protein
MKLFAAALLVQAGAVLEWETKTYYCRENSQMIKDSGVCVPIPFDAPAAEKAKGKSLLTCQANCGTGNVWPKPHEIFLNQVGLEGCPPTTRPHHSPLGHKLTRAVDCAQPFETADVQRNRPLLHHVLAGPLSR